MTRLNGGAVAALLVAGLLGGCGSGASSAVDPAAGGSSTSSSPTSTSSGSQTTDAGNLPPCGSVWRAGAVLPGNYTGCAQGAVAVKADRLGCSSGQHIVRYADHWYAVLGGKIHHSPGLLHDAKYLHSLRTCRG